MRLIDADALLERMMKDPLFPLVERYGVSRVINAEPTVDAVEVVRCKDCKHCYVDGENVRYNVCDLNHNKVQADDWFCADAEKREECALEEGRKD